jgi:FMN phosphatase YigB (HAD superfamily)
MWQDLNQIDNIIFDLGGVILNLDYHQTFHAFKKYAPQIDDDTFVGKSKQHTIFSDYEVGKITSRAFRDELNAFYNMNLDDKTFDECWNAMLFDIPLVRIQLLQKLRTTGKKIFLLSNINEIHEHAVEERFSSLGFKHEFRDLFHRAYYSHLVGMRKPHPEIFKRVLEENDLQTKKTLFIDDSFQHIVGAEAIGLTALHLKTPQKIENLGLFSTLLI